MNDDFESDHAGEDAVAAERLAIRRRAMDLLARREHARAELVAKLKRHEHEAADIDVVLDELADAGLQSDARYAQAAVANKSGRGIGPMRIRSELAAAGVAGADIEFAMADAEVDWTAMARAARRKRFGEARPAGFPARAKQMRFLQRRGFESDQIAAVFND